MLTHFVEASKIHYSNLSDHAKLGLEKIMKVFEFLKRLWDRISIRIIGKKLCIQYRCQ